MTAADPIRVKIAKLMADGRERTVSEIADRIGTDGATIRNHMRAMQIMGLLDCVMVCKGVHVWVSAVKQPMGAA